MTPKASNGPSQVLGDYLNGLEGNEYVDACFALFQQCLLTISEQRRNDRYVLIKSLRLLDQVDESLIGSIEVVSQSALSDKVGSVKQSTREYREKLRSLIEEKSTLVSLEEELSARRVELNNTLSDYKENKRHCEKIKSSIIAINEEMSSIEASIHKYEESSTDEGAICEQALSVINESREDILRATTIAAKYVEEILGELRLRAGDDQAMAIAAAERGVCEAGLLVEATDRVREFEDALSNAETSLRKILT